MSLEAVFDIPIETERERERERERVGFCEQVGEREREVEGWLVEVSAIETI